MYVYFYVYDIVCFLYVREYVCAVPICVRMCMCDYIVLTSCNILPEDMITMPLGAMIVGSLAGLVSVWGFFWLQPQLEGWFRLYDVSSCGCWWCVGGVLFV